MKEKIKNHIKKIQFDKKNIISFSFALIVIAFLYIDSMLPIGVVWGLLVALISFLLIFFMTVAGFFVIKSFVKVSATIILLIFLGQSYCDIPNRTTGGDNALNTLLVFGVFYVVFYFSRELFSLLDDNYKKIEKEKWSKEKLMTVLLILFFVVFFVLIIYQVIMPIIFNLCIYT